MVSRSLEAGDTAGRDRAHAALGGLLGALGAEATSVAQRVTVDEVLGVVAPLASAPRDEWTRGWIAALVAGLARLAGGQGASFAVASHAATALASLRPKLDPGFAQLVDEVERAASRLRPGGRKRLRPSAPDAKLWGEALAHVGQDDFGLSGRPSGRSLVIQRGDRFERSLARILHEVRHRAPDKRQAGAHTSLPRRLGTLRAPPCNMAAATTTAVPAEPVVATGLESWGPHLPTVADCLDAAGHGRVIRLFHPHGETALYPPRGLGRVTATWSLRWNLGRLDTLR